MSHSTQPNTRHPHLPTSKHYSVLTAYYLRITYHVLLALLTSPLSAAASAATPTGPAALAASRCGVAASATSAAAPTPPTAFTALAAVAETAAVAPCPRRLRCTCGRCTITWASTVEERERRGVLHVREAAYHKESITPHRVAPCGKRIQLCGRGL